MNNIDIHSELFRLKKELDQARQIIKNLKAQSRFKRFMDMAEENLWMAQQLDEVSKERDDYKAAFRSYRVAKTD